MFLEFLLIVEYVTSCFFIKSAFAFLRYFVHALRICFASVHRSGFLPFFATFKALSLSLINSSNLGVIQGCLTCLILKDLIGHIVSITLVMMLNQFSYCSSGLSIVFKNTQSEFLILSWNSSRL